MPSCSKCFPTRYHISDQESTLTLKDLFIFLFQCICVLICALVSSVPGEARKSIETGTIGVYWPYHLGAVKCTQDLWKRCRLL
jgi:L-lactate utilization protein LutB